MKLTVRILLYLSVCLLLNSCILWGVAKSDIGTDTLPGKVRKNVCPKFPMEKWCDNSRDTLYNINSIYCVTQEQWSSEYDNAKMLCRNKSKPLKLNDFCNSRQVAMGQELSDVKIKEHQNLYYYLKSESVLSHRYNCKKASVTTDTIIKEVQI